MKDLLEKFENDLKIHLESTFASSNQEDPIRKLDETEKTVFDYVDNYLLESSLIAKDVERSVQLILDEFAKSKIKYIQ
ncbi:hypothetical protein K6T82_03425 [Flavobacterium sp. 17A]|uniref:Uncharacterized protein n=2 Tax=Flavobacterium TaxID=237 RepID=A0A9X1KQ58_9FLAO|nr:MULTISPECIES: hypothetical protein [Flavobacterium]MBW1655927.1 hypothetical protein [Flavobacterium quisquiliarum]MBZ4033801.1 hypothetical protein [Flavobacterium potami]WET03371.1 hypothetical protein P0R33_03335 [Flavobacterium sp. YJ01]